jgi:hypothetical protein
MRKTKKPKQRRKITMGLCLPMAATIIVSRNSPDDDWEVEECIALNGDPPSNVCEHMHEEDFREMDRLIEAAKDCE